MSNAVVIARYLFPHAEAVLKMMQADDGSGDSDALYVLRWIEKHKLTGFTKRDAQQHGRRRFPKATDIDPALTELTARNYIRELPVENTGPGRSPSPRFEVNPKIIENLQAGKCSQNTRNLSKETSAVNSEYSEYTSEQIDNQNRVQVKV